MFTASKLAEYRKGIAAVLGVLAQVIALGVLSGTALHWTQVAVAGLTAVGVLLTPNEKPAGPPA